MVYLGTRIGLTLLRGRLALLVYSGKYVHSIGTVTFERYMKQLINMYHTFMSIREI